MYILFILYIVSGNHSDALGSEGNRPSDSADPLHERPRQLRIFLPPSRIR